MSHFGKKSAMVVMLLVVAMMAFVVGTAVVSTSAQGNVTWPVTTPQPVDTSGAVLQSDQTYSQIYNQIGPSVVSINVVLNTADNSAFQQEQQQNPFGQNNQGGLAEATGTGFVIDTNGDIVTNNHVVQGATEIQVNFFDGSIYRGQLVGADPDADLAVIKVNRPASDLHPVTFGDSDKLFIGEGVAAMGSPFNQPWTLTTGIISALDRQIQSLGQFNIGSVIQTDAAINPGNSGGPLIDLKGEVVGVNSQISTNSGSGSGVGYAIPSNLVKRVAQALIQNGKVSYSYLGISGTDMDLDIMEAMNLPNDARGVVVATVEQGGPAAAAGLQAASNIKTVNGLQVPTSADIITAVNGTPITSMEALIAYLASDTKPGDTIQLTVVRNGTQQLTIPVTLTARPSGT
ncbi:MAG TPA: trypsin-like peptidase domain-containing protein [Phototrophicaceae bacterium]|nr:trypsin-like peptidase domain-containing protein [Phototrophicaceae bacterium]